MEEHILLTLEFNLFVEPKKIDKTNNSMSQQYSNNSLYEILMIVLEMTSVLIPKQKQSFYF